jgi:hypothetical protein
MASGGKIGLLIAEDNAAYRYALISILKEYPSSKLLEKRQTERMRFTAPKNFGLRLS